MSRIITSLFVIFAFCLTVPQAFANEEVKKKDDNIFIFIKTDESGDEIYKNSNKILWDVMWRSENGIVVDKNASDTFDKPSFYKVGPSLIDIEGGNGFIDCATKP